VDMHSMQVTISVQLHCLSSYSWRFYCK